MCSELSLILWKCQANMNVAWMPVVLQLTTHLRHLNANVLTQRLLRWKLVSNLTDTSWGLKTTLAILKTHKM